MKRGLMMFLIGCCALLGKVEKIFGIDYGTLVNSSPTATAYYRYNTFAHRYYIDLTWGWSGWFICPNGPPSSIPPNSFVNYIVDGWGFDIVGTITWYADENGTILLKTDYIDLTVSDPDYVPYYYVLATQIGVEAPNYNTTVPDPDKAKKGI